MVSNLQFAAVAAYLLWCLFASLSDVIGPGRNGAGSAIDESDKNVSVGSAMAHHGGHGGRKGVR